MTKFLGNVYLISNIGLVLDYNLRIIAKHGFLKRTTNQLAYTVFLQDLSYLKFKFKKN